MSGKPGRSGRKPHPLQVDLEYLRRAQQACSADEYEQAVRRVLQRVLSDGDVACFRALTEIFIPSSGSREPNQPQDAEQFFARAVAEYNALREAKKPRKG